MKQKFLQSRLFHFYESERTKNNLKLKKELIVLTRNVQFHGSRKTNVPVETINPFSEVGFCLQMKKKKNCDRCSTFGSIYWIQFYVDSVGQLFLLEIKCNYTS